MPAHLGNSHLASAVCLDYRTPRIMIRFSVTKKQNTRHRVVSGWWSVDEPPGRSGGLPLFITRCGFARWVGERSYSRKNSESTVLELVLAGNAEYTQDGESHLAEPGDFLILRQWRPHSYTTGPAGFVHKRYLNLEGRAVDEILVCTNLKHKTHVRLRNPVSIERLMRRAGRVLRESPPNANVEIACLAYRMLVQVGQSSSLKQPYAVTKALDFMRTHRAEKIHLADLTNATGMSEAHFCRTFKHHVGMAPVQYFRHLKLERAKRILAETDDSITAISDAIGMTDAMYFSRQFKKHTGVSPTQWRANLK